MTQPAIENTPGAWDDRAVEPSSWQAAMWGSESGQTQRFLAALRHLQPRAGDHLLDYGCGTGRLCSFLPRTVAYYGYDWAPRLLERMREEHPRAHALDEIGARSFDMTVAIGPFTLRHNWTTEQTWQEISKLWKLHTKRALVVCLYRGNDPRSLAYDPADALEFAKNLGCPGGYAVDCTYLANDFILALHR